MNLDRISPAFDLALGPCLSHSAPLLQNHSRPARGARQRMGESLSTPKSTAEAKAVVNCGEGQFDRLRIKTQDERNGILRQLLSGDLLQRSEHAARKGT